LTADFSHWVVGSERLLDDFTQSELYRDFVVPRVRHIHARTGSPQSPQVAVPAQADAATRACLRSHQAMWLDVWEHQLSSKWRAQGCCSLFRCDA
jgi:hypothetical protein